MKRKKIIMSALALMFALFLFSCTEKDLTASHEQATKIKEIKTVQELQIALNNVYDEMTSANYYGRNMALLGELRSDNCYVDNRVFSGSAMYSNIAAMQMTNADGTALGTWNSIYTTISNANLVIYFENIELTGPLEEKKQIVGQAYAIRAMAHFDLLKLFGQMYVDGGTTPGGIPYVTEFKPEGETMTPTRNTVDQVKQSIYSDITVALSMMTELQNSKTSIYMTTYAVHALKSRVALYFKDYQAVKEAADVVINSKKYKVMPADDYIASWKKLGNDNNVNSIFELPFSTEDHLNLLSLYNAYRGRTYGNVKVLKSLQDCFDNSDVRKKLIAETKDGRDAAATFLSNVGKFQSLGSNNNIPIFRYEEVVLNYAEALFFLDPKSEDVKTRLNEIPMKRGATLHAEATLDNILLERRREFCFEGFRFDDLVRCEKPIPAQTAPSGANTHGDIPAKSSLYALPIPVRELSANPNLKDKQNKGY